MAYGTPRPPLDERLRRAAQHPFVAALLGGLVVLLAVLVLAAAGVIGGEDKTTVVQSPVSSPSSVADSKTPGLTVNGIYRKDAPGVAFIRAEVVQASDSPFNPFPQSQRGTATGSGFVIDESGDILTNAHVVEGARTLTVTLKDGREFDGTVVESDTDQDLAVVKIDGSDLPTAEIGSSKDLEVGQLVIAIGSPLGQFTNSVTSGVLSAIGREIQVPDEQTGRVHTLSNLLQTDAAINPGNSGGPLLDEDGRIVGINTAVAGGANGIGFAIPIDDAAAILAAAMGTTQS
jgi:S1-C subfamily serine protease